MIRSIVESSLKYRHLVVVAALLLMFFGFTQLRKMPVDVFPEFEPPLVEIQTEALGLSAEEVESLITLNIEEFLSGTPWLQTIRSESIPGLSSILLIFKPGTDLMRARQLVQENLSRAYTLPNVSKPPVMLQPMSATRRAMMVALSSKELSPIQLSVLAQWTIKPRLMGVQGVSNVVIWGQKNRQLQVQIDPKRLKENNLTQEQIIKTTGDALWVSQLSFLEASVPGTGGWIDTPNQRLGIRHVLPISSPEDIAKLPVYNSKQRLGEVAEVVEGHPPLIGDTFLDQGTGIILVIEKFPWANTLEVTHGVDQALDSLKAGLPGVDIDSNIYRLSSFIDTAIDNLSLALIISTALVILAIIVFFYDWRASLISIIAIPLSIITAALVLYFMGASINIMVLTGFGIALGAVADDAIIDIENIIRRIRQPRKESDKKSLFALLLDASLEVRTPIIYATLIMVLAILPVFFMQGVSGAFFRPLALSYSLALLASMIIALTVTPALAYLFFRNDAKKHPESPTMNWLHGKYDSLLSKTVNTPLWAFIATAAVLVLSLLIWPFLGQSFLPTFKEGDLIIEVDGPPGTSHPEISRIMSRLGKELTALPGITRVVGHSGRAIGGDRIVGMHSSQIWAKIDPQADHQKTIDAVRDVVAGYDGLDRDVQTYLRGRIREVLSGESEEIVVRLYGPKREVLLEKAGDIRKALSEIPGIADLQVEGQIDEPHVEVKVDLAKATPLGIKPGDVRRASATVFAGLEAGNLFEEQKVFDVVVWSIPKARNSLTSIKELLIDKPDGGYVRLGDIADVKIVPGPTAINHEAISPHIDIVANVRGRDLGVVSKEVEERLKKIDFPLEYHPELLGEYAERQAAKRQILGIGIAAAIGIFFLLQAAFNSWRLATLAFIALPVAVIGGILATAMNGFTISIGSLVGFLAVLGIAARNGIMLINHYQNLEQNEKVPFGSELVLRGARERLKPILMTAVTTAAALLPFVFLSDRAGLEILYPMAVVILGGLVTSTLLILLIIPPLYLLLRSRSKPTPSEG